MISLAGKACFMGSARDSPECTLIAFMSRGMLGSGIYELVEDDSRDVARVAPPPHLASPPLRGGEEKNRAGLTERSERVAEPRYFPHLSTSGSRRRAISRR